MSKSTKATPVNLCQSCSQLPIAECLKGGSYHGWGSEIEFKVTPTSERITECLICDEVSRNCPDFGLRGPLDGVNVLATSEKVHLQGAFGDLVPELQSTFRLSFRRRFAGAVGFENIANFNICVRSEHYEVARSQTFTSGFHHLSKFANIVDDTVGNNFKFVQDQYDLCRSEHPRCASKSEQQELPYRVIDLSLADTGVVSLKECEETEHGDYAALSHCWGRSQEYTSTTKNLHERKQSMIIDSMPKTFRDAIEVATSLKFRYLWIDSLCILQDDLQDWDVEALKMREVYSNAGIVIVASNSEGDDQGFLGPRSLGRIAHCPSLSTELEFPCYLQLITMGTCYGINHNTKEPLESRAWTMQEVLLGTRKVIFRQHQMYWDCSTIQVSEDGGQGWPIRLQQLPILDKLSNTSQSNQRLSKDGLRELWYWLVRQYTRRALSVQTDVFPALAGLASLTAEALDEEYVAGIWSGDILNGVLWRPAGQPMINPNIYNTNNKTRTDRWLAPSWSWASIAYPIEFVCTSRFSHRFEREQWHELAVILGHELKYKGVSRYGIITGGSLRLQTPVFQVKRFRGPFECELADGFMEAPVSDPNISITIEVNNKEVAIAGSLDNIEELDNVKADAAGRYFACFLLQLVDVNSEVELPSWRRFFGLLLRRLENEDFERIGVVQGNFMEDDEISEDSELMQKYWTAALTDILSHTPEAPPRSDKWHHVDLRDMDETTIVIT